MIQAVLLALIAGYADTVGFLRYDAFAGLMTGNTILLGIDIASQRFGGAGFHALIIAAFLGGVVLAQALRRVGTPVWATLCIAALLLAACGFFDRQTSSLVLPLAMGLQNSAANRFNGVALNTVFITGNIQKVGEGLIHWIWPSRDPNAPPPGAFAIYAFVWLAYALGAVAGALADRWLTHPLLLPAMILPLVMLPWDRLRPSDARV